MFDVTVCVCRALLLRECECAEEGARNVVAECLGKLTLIDPAVLLPRLKEQLRTSSPLIRATVVTAVKFTISEQVRTLHKIQRSQLWLSIFCTAAVWFLLT